MDKTVYLGSTELEILVRLANLAINKKGLEKAKILALSVTDHLEEDDAIIMFIEHLSNKGLTGVTFWDDYEGPYIEF